MKYHELRDLDIRGSELKLASYRYDDIPWYLCLIGGWGFGRISSPAWSTVFMVPIYAFVIVSGFFYIYPRFRGKRGLYTNRR